MRRSTTVPEMADEIQVQLISSAEVQEFLLGAGLDRTQASASLVSRPSLYGWGEKGEGRKGLVNNSTPTRIHGSIPAVSVDEGKRECQVGVSRE